MVDMVDLDTGLDGYNAGHGGGHGAGYSWLTGEC